LKKEKRVELEQTPNGHMDTDADSVKLDKAVKDNKLSKRQEKRNKQKSRVRSGVEHVFARLKSGMNYVKSRANTLIRNRLRFDFNCIVYTVLRGLYLLKIAK